MKKLRIGLVGSGNIAKAHLTAYQNVEQAEIVAICDINEKVLADTAQKFGIAKTYTSETEMLANEELDAVDVCVWNCSHACCSIEALNAGLQGGPVIDLGVHVIDLTRYLMGKPKVQSVFASVESRLGNRPYLKTNVGWSPEAASADDLCDVEDFAVALIKYEDGKTTLLETSYSLNGEEMTKKELFGTKGGMNLNGTECLASAEDGLEVMRILDAIYESARTGHEIVIRR